jgi:hypothetical protein
VLPTDKRGCGSSISSESGYGSRGLMTKNFKKIQLTFFSKIAKKAFIKDGRSLQPSKENIQHFKR